MFEGLVALYPLPGQFRSVYLKAWGVFESPFLIFPQKALPPLSLRVEILSLCQSLYQMTPPYPSFLL